MSLLKVISIDEPEVRSSPPSPYRVREGGTATLVCTVIDANPSTNITWRWFKRDSGSFFLLVHNGPIYVITNISREISKRYRYSCLVSNTVGTSYAADIVIDVQCKYYYIKILVHHNKRFCRAIKGA